MKQEWKLMASIIVILIAVACAVVIISESENSNDLLKTDSSENSTSIKYTISVTKEGDGNISGAGTFNSGSTVAVTATPNNGFRFSGWYKNDSFYSTSSTLNFKAQEDLRLTAKFDPIVCSIKVNVNNSDVGTVSGGGNITYGSYCTVSTTLMNSAYQFVGWYSGDKLMSSSPSYTFKVSGDVSLQAKYSVIHDASFSTSLSTTVAPTIISMISKYNTEVSYRTWTVTDTLTGRTVKFEDGINGAGNMTSVRIDVGMGVNITQTILYMDGVRESKTANVVVNEIKTVTFNWKYHEDYRGAWWNPFDHDNLDPTSMNKDASLTLSMNFSWYYKYASDPIIRGYMPSYLATFVNSNDPVVKSLAATLKSRTIGWSDIDRANYVLHFVQSIPYGYDDQVDAMEEHWSYPAETLWRKKGDCEDHAILYAALMKELGYKTALLWVQTSSGGHLATGLNVNSATGICYVYGGVSYFYCEATPGLTQSFWRNVGYMPSGYTVVGIYPV